MNDHFYDFFFFVIIVFDMDSFLFFFYLLLSYYLGRVKLAFEAFEILNSRILKSLINNLTFFTP